MVLVYVFIFACVQNIPGSVDQDSLCLFMTPSGADHLSCKILQSAQAGSFKSVLHHAASPSTLQLDLLQFGCISLM